jgi:hypothetical protein
MTLTDLELTKPKRPSARKETPSPLLQSSVATKLTPLHLSILLAWTIFIDHLLGVLPALIGLRSSSLPRKGFLFHFSVSQQVALNFTKFTSQASDHLGRESRRINGATKASSLHTCLRLKPLILYLNSLTPYLIYHNRCLRCFSLKMKT